MVDILNSCIEEDILAEFLGRYGTEAIGMMFKELTQEEAMEMSRQDGYALGVEKGRSEGEASGRAAEKLEMAKAMKAENIDVDTIAKVSGLSKEDIDRL